MNSYQRPFVSKLLKRLLEPDSRMQVLLGPRQVGKTTGVQQLLKAWPGPSHYASADALSDPRGPWMSAQWEQAALAQKAGQRALLVLDEVQKVHAWSEEAKKLWDANKRAGDPMAVCLLGSSAMLMDQGLTESLAGRFERNSVGHWQYAEMRQAFAWDLETYIFFGGYPGAAQYIHDEGRWAEYVGGTLIESAIGRDVLAMNSVAKPALLRRLFGMACEHAAEVLSYNKMLGQLTEAGNASTLAHYQALLDTAGLLRGLQKFTGNAVSRRASSPKWLPMNTALITAQRGLPFKTWRARPDLWGRLVEAAVGTHLAAETAQTWGARLDWWREGNYEVDYVLQAGGAVCGLEVKSGRAGLRSAKGLSEFKRRFPKARTRVIGAEGISLAELFEKPLSDLI